MDDKRQVRLKLSGNENLGTKFFRTKMSWTFLRSRHFPRKCLPCINWLWTLHQFRSLAIELRSCHVPCELPNLPLLRRDGIKMCYCWILVFLLPTNFPNAYLVCLLTNCLSAYNLCLPSIHVKSLTLLPQ